MFNELVDTVRRLRREDPEKYNKGIARLIIGIGVSSLIIVAGVNVASVITVFPF